MVTSIQLASGLAGAIGCDYRRINDQLFFVEYAGGRVSVLDLVRPVSAIVSQGNTLLKGTWLFDCETGTLGGNLSGPGDIWWEQVNAVERKMVPIAGAKLVNLGKVDFNAITHAELQNLTYSTTPIPGNNDATNQLVTGDVFAVITNAGNFTKIKVVNYGYDMTIQWVTYKLGPRYRVLGTGYTQPEDLKLRSDNRYAYVTERTGNLLRVDLMNANRTAATVISSGMNAPQQIVLDEARNLVYVVEYADPGRLLRIDLTSGVQTVLVHNLTWAIGLAMSSDFQTAYISEQSQGRDAGRVSRIMLSTGNREVLVQGLVNPFFLTWVDANQSILLIPERDPANRVTMIDLTRTPFVAIPVFSAVPGRPSSVAVKSGNQILVCSDQEITQVDLAQSFFNSAGSMLMGIGHVPKDKIIDGYATTDTNYFFKVKDAPFGGTLALMINHDKARSLGAQFYQIYVDRSTQNKTWNDYKWVTGQNAFVLTPTLPTNSNFFPVRSAGEVWYNKWLGYQLNTTALIDGLHTITVKLFNQSYGEIPNSADSVKVQIDNHWPQVAIDEIIHDASVVGTCGIVDAGSDVFTFRIVAQDAEQHLLSWTLLALWGNNKSATVALDTYENQLSNPVVASTKKWAGVNGTTPIPAAGWHATVPNDPTSRRCAHTFRLAVWDRVINGWNYIHYAEYNKSITIMLPPAA